VSDFYEKTSVNGGDAERELHSKYDTTEVDRHINIRK